MNTARVSLRDGHLEVFAEIDEMALEALRSPADTARMQRLLETDMHLHVDDVPVEMELRPVVFPDKEPAAAPHNHGALVPIHWESKRRIFSGAKIAVVFPKELGPVLISFVQPSTNWTPAGTTAQFAILEAPRQTPPAEPSRNGWGIAAMTLACLAILGNVMLFRRRRSTTLTPP
ncbi:MAG TPA: hypothetical protein PKA58_26240 [Polyangium sp.]|nr:hypothetical protein [Polyangium sp.]